MNFIFRWAGKLRFRRLKDQPGSALPPPGFDDQLKDAERIAECVEQIHDLTSLLMFNVAADCARNSEEEGGKKSRPEAKGLAAELEKLDCLFESPGERPLQAVKKVRHLSLIQGGRA